MECNFKLNLGNYEVKAPTMEGLLHNLTEHQITQGLGIDLSYYQPHNISWSMPLFQSDLNYFSSEGEKVSHIFEHVWKRDEKDNLVFDPEPEAKVKWYTPEGTHVTSIAKIKGHWMSDNRAGWSTQQLVYAEEYSDFVKDFGTHLHKFVELRIKYGTEYWTKQETIDHLKEVSEWLAAYTEKARKWDTNVVAKAKSVQDFLINLNEESLNESVQTLVQSLIEYMKPSDDPTLTILAEIPVKYKTQRGELIQGRIDALTYDDEGNVHIYDYKTSMSVMNESSKAAYTFQLNAYKAMLGALGISAKKVHIHILPIQYGFQGGKSTMTFMIDRVDTTKMSLGVALPINLAQTVIKKLRTYFTTSTTPLELEEAARRKSILDDQINAIITPLAKNKAAVELQKRYLKSALDNNNSIYVHSALDEYGTPGVFILTLKQEGDIIIGYDVEGKKKFRGTLDEIAEAEANAIKDQLSERTELLSQAIAIGSYEDVKYLFDKNEDLSTAMLMALEPYFAAEWEEIHIPELKNRNIITMFNRTTGEYSFIIVSDFASINTSRKAFDDNKLIPPNANILYSVLDESALTQFREMKSIPGISIEEHLTLEAILAISQYKDLLPDGKEKIKLDRIQVISAISGAQSFGTNLDKYVTTLLLLEHIAKKDPSKIKVGSPELFTSIYSQFRDNFDLSDPIQSAIKVVINRIGGYKLNDPNVGLDMFSSLNLEVDLLHIKEMQDELKSEFPDEWNNPEKPIGRIYLGLDDLAATIKSGKVHEQMHAGTKWGLTGAELFGAGLDLIRYGESRRYSYNGMLIAGMAQGLDNSVSYASPDETIRLFQQMFSSASQQVNMETIDIAVDVNNATQEYLEQVGMTALNRNVLGNTDAAYELLYEQANGKVSGQMILKNPYGSSGLTPVLSKYLKIILWSFNRLRMKSLPDSIKKLSYAELEKNTEAHQDYVKLINQNDKYRHVPLIRTDGAANLITSFQVLINPNESVQDERTRVGRFVDNLKDRWNQQIEPLLLTPELKKYNTKDFNPDKKEMLYHSPYNAQNEHRAEMLLKTDMRNWALNLNFLAIEYAAAHYKEIYFNQLLSLCGNLLGQIQMAEIMTGLKLEETRKALIGRIKVSIFSTDLIPEEAKTMSTILGGLKQATSYLKIAVRPALFVKEMVLGAIKNSATIWALNLINDVPITFNHIMKAATVVYTNGLFSDNAGSFEGETFGNFRLINLLNNLYRINDRDLNVIGDSLAYDSHGFMHAGSRMLYLNTTSPDWFNRMTLLVAKMMADGTWDAHSRSKDGKLVYDIYKDERYKEFVSYYKAHNGDLSREPVTESYVKAKALFQLKVLQLLQLGLTHLKAGENGVYSVDEILVAYSQQEMDSFKEQVGMLFGYYSHEERTNVQKSLAWLMHTQFLTFLPGEIRKYLASGQIESSVGKTVHVMDPVTKEKLYYRTTEDGLHEVVRESLLAPDEKKEPVYEFTFVPVEGLLVSTLKTLNEIFTGKWDSELNKDRHNRAKLFLFNFLLSIMLKALWVILGISGFDAAQASKENALLAQTIDLTSRVSQELNFFETVVAPIGNLGITGLDLLPQVSSVTMSLLGNTGYTLMDGARTLAPIIKDTHLFDN